MNVVAKSYQKNKIINNLGVNKNCYNFRNIHIMYSTNGIFAHKILHLIVFF